VLRAVDPRFEFTDPPFRHSLPMALAFAATAGRPTAVLTGPGVTAGTWPGPIRLQRLMGSDDMVRVSLQDRPLTATAALVWSGDLLARSSRSCSTPPTASPRPPRSLAPSWSRSAPTVPYESLPARTSYVDSGGADRMPLLMTCSVWWFAAA
jgi:hypothetical protein